MRIMICDDDVARAEVWKEQVAAAAAGHQVDRIDNALKAIGQLVDRKKRLIDEKIDLAFGDCEFDEVDVLVVDYDLIMIDEGGSRTTGEGVARLVKSYSNCKYVIVLNQFSRVDFDLGMTGHLTSFADLNVNDRVIGQPALWTGAGEFDPSGWPNVLETVPRWTKVAEGLGNDLNWKVLELLGLLPDELHNLSDTAFAYLSQGVETLGELAEVTALQFLQRVLGPPEAELLGHLPIRVRQHLAVSRVAKWLDRAVLRPLDTLMDAAHLAERMPFLLTGDADVASLDFWAELGGKEANYLGLGGLEAAKCAMARELIGKDVYVLRRIERDEALQKLADDFDYSKVADVVFAEDTSTFLPRTAATGFRAGFNNFNDRRFVKKVGDLDYGPQRRFAFGD